MAHPSSWHPAARHATSFGITLAATFTSIALAALVQPSYYFPLTAAIVICSWIFGRAEGFQATGAGAILAGLLLVRPRLGHELTLTSAIMGLVVFVLIGAGVAWLTSSLRDTRDRHTSILESMSDALVLTDRKGCISYVNPAAEALTGWPLEEAKAKGFDEIFPLQNEESGERRSGLIAEMLQSGNGPQSVSHTILRARDGTEYSVEESAAPVRNLAGQVTGATVVLRNTTRRRQMQDQLTQSQKMEAIARLAGGVAGDFNNLLTVITGFSELLISEMATGNPLRRFAEEILVAAGRAAGLSRQLLAFGKGQSIPAKPHNLNELVQSMSTMIERVIGSNVRLVVQTNARSPKIKTDPGQIEQIVLNLAMNARDAMPQGGKLIIETSDAEVKRGATSQHPDLPPGNYVMLAVTDNGVGIDPETRARLFEPFFTTKAGQSSGLGLSIVYGIVKQHNGHISVYSQPGAGTIFELYFPRVEKLDVVPVAARPGRRGDETILVADDEEAVRKLVLAVLATNGYKVIEARDGREAFDLYQAHRNEVDMVLTDVVMPHMTGYELGAEIEKTDPEKKILFMSGFRDAHVPGQYESSRPFLNKPFTPDALLKQIRAIFDGPQATKSR